MEEKKLLQEKLKEEMQQFYAAREMWKAKERLVIQQEEEKIRQINEQREKEKEKAEAEASAKKFAKQITSDKLLQQHKEIQVSS